MIQEIMTYACMAAASGHLIYGTYNLFFKKSGKTKCQDCNGNCHVEKSYLIKN